MQWSLLLLGTCRWSLSAKFSQSCKLSYHTRPFGLSGRIFVVLIWRYRCACYPLLAPVVWAGGEHMILLRNTKLWGLAETAIGADTNDGFLDLSLSWAGWGDVSGHKHSRLASLSWGSPYVIQDVEAFFMLETECNRDVPLDFVKWRANSLNRQLCHYKT